MSTSPDYPNGTDLLAQEIREEASRIAHHPVAEVKRLEHVAAEGDSPTTPLLLVVGVTAVVAVVVALVTTIALLVYYAG
jgi:hypothetical protein